MDLEVITLPLAAFGAGVISFSSPCCIPLVPAYLSYVSALPVSELERVHARRVTTRATALFVAGFTVVFTALGVSFAFVGSALSRQIPMILKAAGVFIIIAGLAMDFSRSPHSLASDALICLAFRLERGARSLWVWHSPSDGHRASGRYSPPS
jgi:cytochrome c biogenesis protein CcdA